MTHTIQYDMGLRLWVLSDPTGQIIHTYFSRTSALQDRAVRRIIDGGGLLRVRNADGTFVATEAMTSARAVPLSAPTVSEALPLVYA
ncbi:hypothetical protein CNR27_01890 [Luteimonas chenhongjianii]|uniref:Uncharacterized protein n=1 Tax=Luteimonas chenhongjianii TaxID=2006110 RepID=A0A290XB51_9GAMM|nr:hypothetical protein [Luteimonas chenhongjianii]ATD66350.1 hypothetical protein CNR27_01890 [Luteimonas chenhongjianii]